jgi:hypothetical protein
MEQDPNADEYREQKSISTVISRNKQDLKQELW